MPQITFRGKFDGNWDALPFGGDKPGAVPFKEMEMHEATRNFTIVSTILFLAFAIPFYFIYGFDWFSLWGLVLMIPAMFVHEYLHAICFKEHAYIYTALDKGLLFATGPESFGKARFVFMSLLPNLVFGVAPIVAFLINPSLNILGTFGVVMFISGTGDYYNVYNTLTQVPKGALIYLKGEKTLWYRPTA